jgi:hypothetical protein
VTRERLEVVWGPSLVDSIFSAGFTLYRLGINETIVEKLELSAEAAET